MVNLKQKFGKNINITDRPLFTKQKKHINLNHNILTNINNSKTKKLREDNKKLMIDCKYFSNKEKYDISGDKWIKKYKNHISSLTSSTWKLNNTSSCTKKEKKIIIASSKHPYVKINNDFSSKSKKQTNKKINNNKINNKIIIDDFTGNSIFPNTTQTAQNDSMLNIEGNQRFNSDFNSFEYKLNQDNILNNSKINNLKKESTKVHGKIFIKKDNLNLLKSIKVNKNNYLDKGNNKNCFNNISSNNEINMKIHSFLKLNSNNKINNLKKSGKNKTRLQSCKFSNEQIQKLEKELITESNIRYRKLVERAYRKIKNLKINQSNSATERKNITFFANYIKNNKIYINNNNININRYYTNGNLSSYINNKSEIIRNNTNTNFNKNYKNILTTNKKRKKVYYIKKLC